MKYPCSPLRALTALGLALTLSACSGGASVLPGSSAATTSNSPSNPASTPTNPTTPSAPLPATVALDYLPGHTLRIHWSEVEGATHYKVFENPDGASGYVQLGDDIAAGTLLMDHRIGLHQRVNARYVVESCNASGCSASPEESIDVIELSKSIGYAKASNTGPNDYFGIALSLSADGNTLAVGAYGESSRATGIDGDQTDNSASGAGAVYVFSRASDGAWSQQAYLKASNAEPNDYFGIALSVSADGNTLAVGAYGESSRATGIDGDQSDNSASRAGAVYVFSRVAAVWSEQAYVKASNAESNDYFGFALTLSGDGDTLAVGAYGEDSSATGVNANAADNSASQSGAVYVFSRASSGVWSQQAYLKASNTESNDWFGFALTLSGDGNTLAVGAYTEASSATGINGDQSDNSSAGTGAAYVFSRVGGAWSQQAYLKASNAESSDYFGIALSVSADGNTLAIGAFGEFSNAVGVDGDQTDNSASYAGAVYVFSRGSSGMWSQQAYLKASNAESNDQFGYALSLSADGNTLAVGAYTEDSNATGINGDQADNSAGNAGAVYVYSRVGGAWSQQAYLKASKAEMFDNFGYGLSVSGDGSTLAVGAYQEASNATGINGDQTDNSASLAGAVYLY